MTSDDTSTSPDPTCVPTTAPLPWRAGTAAAAALLLAVASVLAVVGLAPPADAAGHHHRHHHGHHGHHHSHRPGLTVHFSAAHPQLQQRVVAAGRARHLGRPTAALQVQRHHRWHTVKTKRTGRSGRFSIQVPTTEVGEHRYRVRAHSARGTATSRPQHIAVRRQKTTVAITWPQASTTVGTSAQATGTVSTSVGDRTVTLQRAVPGGWSTLSRATTHDRRFRLTVPTAYLASLSLRLVVAGTHKATGSTTADPAHFVVTPSWTAGGSAADHTFEDSPVGRWNPCQPIRYRVNLQQAPASASLTDVERAVYRISQATGLRFVYQGTSQKVPQDNYRQSYGKHTNFLIAWTPTSGSDIFQTNDTSEGIAARGGISSEYRRGFVDGAGHHVIRYVKGSIVVNTAFNGDYMGGDSSNQQTWTQLLMHELGHGVGLNHASQPSQIMYPSTGNKPAVYGAGDLAGLEREGWVGGCLHRQHRHHHGHHRDQTRGQNLGQTPELGRDDDLRLSGPDTPLDPVYINSLD